MARQTKLLTMLAVLTAFIISGCGDIEEPQLERANQALLYWIPQFPVLLSVDLVGHGLNGESLNGHPLEGHVVAGVSLADVQMSNGAPKHLKLKNTLFKGPKVVGLEFSGWLDDGSPIQIRIDDAYPADEYGGAWLRYTVSFATEGGWQPLCGVDDADEPIPAIPLNGLWDYQQGVPDGGSWTDSDDSFTFACEGFTLAKCVELGYPPWAGGKICDDEAKGKKCEKTTLAAHHQACVRALRADYCGDGTSYTVDGVPLNLYDGLGIRQDGDDWAFEAEWDESGARCVAIERLPDVAPACADALDQPNCGTPEHFETGTLVISEVEPSGSSEQ